MDFPDLPTDMTDAAAADAAAVTAPLAQDAHAHAREAARKRVRATMPPIPELRFEPAYLRSIGPALLTQGGEGTAAAVYGGRAIGVVWSKLAWITWRDQVISPLLQGVFWGLLSVTAAGTGAALRAALWGPQVVRRA